MAEGGYAVQDILREAAVPATRPIDHARRMGTAFALGSVGGTILGVLTLKHSFSLHVFVVMLAVLVGFVLVGLFPWVLRPRAAGSAVPVVGRVLGTREPIEQRLVKRSGSESGLIVPVVCRPVEGRDGGRSAAGGSAGGASRASSGQDFRAVVVLSGIDPTNPVGPQVGTLIPLLQTEAGMGELAEISGEPTEGQRELMARLEARPKSLRNTAPVLPVRRSCLERVPVWAGAQFYGAAFLGAIAAVLAISYLAG